MFGVRFRGRLTQQDMKALRDALNSVADTQPRIYLLLDMTGSTGIDAEARRFMATWSREPNRGLLVTVLYGLSFTMRTLVTLTLNAIRLLGRLDSDIQFFTDEAEARGWVAEHRARTGG